MANARWLKGNGQSEFLQFASGRVTRERHGGAFSYTTTRPLADAPLYVGPSYADAVAALPQRNEAVAEPLRTIINSFGGGFGR